LILPSLLDDSLGPCAGEPSILTDRAMQSIEIMDQVGGVIPLIRWGSQLQDLQVSAG